jgi:hypothetical protein
VKQIVKKIKNIRMEIVHLRRTKIQHGNDNQKQNIIHFISEYAYQLKHDVQKLLIKLKCREMEKPPVVPDVKQHQQLLELKRMDTRERREDKFVNFDLQHATM